MSYYLPLFAVVVSNAFYHICAKATPAGVNPFASLAVTYLAAAGASAALYAATGRGTTVAGELAGLNWACLGLGLCVVGLEAGFIYMYKAGWPVSTAQVVQSALVAVVLAGAGFALYHEALTAAKAAGLATCMLGLWLLSR
ncbi:MAG: EamA family transporter [Duodenibacillus sp.]|nr:EamA family transporter [Duodenibacillus sp.]